MKVILRFVLMASPALAGEAFFALILMGRAVVLPIISRRKECLDLL